MEMVSEENTIGSLSKAVRTHITGVSSIKIRTTLNTHSRVEIPSANNSRGEISRSGVYLSKKSAGNI